MTKASEIARINLGGQFRCCEILLESKLTFKVEATKSIYLVLEPSVMSPLT